MALNVTLTTQAPASGTYPGVTATGSGIAAPGDNDWSVADGESNDGDILTFDILANQTPETDYQIEYYEVAIEEDGGAEASVERLFFGPWTNKPRNRLVTSGKSHRVRVRSVQKYKNTLLYDNGPYAGYTPQVGDVVVQSSTSSQGTVVHRDGKYIVLDNITGNFASSFPTDITIDGNNAQQDGPLHPSVFTGYSTTDVEVVRSEWSNPVEITQTSAVPGVTISADKTSCIQGEAVLLTVETTGFTFEGPTYDPLHELHFEWNVSKPGEQGSFTALSNSYFEDEFGASQNDRCQSFSSIWVFTPHTTGSVDVDITVRDRAGNSYSTAASGGTLTLTSTAPTSYFSDAETFAVSASSRIPAGTGLTSGDIYSDLDLAIADIPASGKALVLLDTTGSHGIASEGLADFRGVAADEICIMPYSASGVGVEAGGRVSIDWAMVTDSTNTVLHGVDCIGPFDNADPYTNGNPGDGISCANGSRFTCDSCNVSGWGRNFLPPPNYLMSDVESTDYFDYGVQQGDPTDHGFSGCYFYQNPAAWHGDAAGGHNTRFETTPPFFVDHTNYRASRPAGVRGFSKCVFYAGVGWDTPPLGQNPLRFFGVANTFPHNTHVTEIVCEGRINNVIQCTSASGGSFDAPQSIVIDKWASITGTQPISMLTVSVAPITLRNIRGVFPDVDGLRGGAGAAFCVFLATSSAGVSKPQFDALAQPIVLECITAVNMVTTGKVDTSSTFDLYNTGSGFTNVTARNNITYSPNLAATDDTGPFVTTTRYTPLYTASYYWDSTGGTGDDLSWNLANSVDTANAHPGIMSATFEPQAGSSAYQTATGSIPYDDILSRVRPTAGTASKGAYDPGGT